MKRILVLTGTPGVGKSTVARQLASGLPGLHVDVNDVVAAEKLIIGADEARKTQIADIPRAARRIMEIVAETSGYVIIDGHYASELVEAKDLFMAFILRRDPVELQLILRKRGYDPSKVSENVASEILDVCLVDALQAYGKDKVCEIDCSSKDSTTIVEEIGSILNKRKKCRVGIVDWLTKLETEGTLDSLLASKP
ncbi:MAG: adenylate kinase family protein [Candidatus Bathyarchaeota archaeon]|nr:MAG: adenylate kinase family protein [Candidatus Bathyarchaeota archaeon]